MFGKVQQTLKREVGQLEPGLQQKLSFALKPCPTLPSGLAALDKVHNGVPAMQGLISLAILAHSWVLVAGKAEDFLAMTNAIFLDAASHFKYAGLALEYQAYHMILQLLREPAVAKTGRCSRDTRPQLFCPSTPPYLSGDESGTLLLEGVCQNFVDVSHHAIRRDLTSRAQGIHGLHANSTASSFQEDLLLEVLSRDLFSASKIPLLLHHICWSGDFIEPLQCDECLTFCVGPSGQTNLKKHKDSCSNPRIYNCKDCKTPCTLQRNLNAHRKEKSGKVSCLALRKPQSYTCDLCRETFTMRDSLSTHMRNQHNG